MARDDQPPSAGRLFSLGELETVSAAAVMGLVTAKAAHSHCLQLSSLLLSAVSILSLSSAAP